MKGGYIMNKEQQTKDRVAVRVENRFIIVTETENSQYMCAILNENRIAIKSFNITPKENETAKDIMEILVNMISWQDTDKQLKGNITRNSIVTECAYEEVMYPVSEAVMKNYIARHIHKMVDELYDQMIMFASMRKNIDSDDNLVHKMRGLKQMSHKMIHVAKDCDFQSFYSEPDGLNQFLVQYSSADCHYQVPDEFRFDGQVITGNEKKRYTNMIVPEDGNALGNQLPTTQYRQ